MNYHHCLQADCTGAARIAIAIGAGDREVRLLFLPCGTTLLQFRHILIRGPPPLRVGAFVNTLELLANSIDASIMSAVAKFS